MRSLVPVLALAAAFAAPVALHAQQLALALNDNPSYSNNAVGWPASVLAFRFTATVPIVAAAQVFTGNQPPAVHTVEIRTRNATTGLPDQLVGQPGTWSTTHTRCFQGAELAQPANLIVGVDYFLVWRVTGMFHQHSISDANEPSNVAIEVRVSDGATWHAQTTLPAKFRLLAPYPTGTTLAFGAGKLGIYGEPTIGLHGWPSLASPLDVWLDNAARNVIAVLVIGTPITGGVQLGFADLFVTPDLLLAFVTRTHTSPLTGGISYTMHVPNQPSAVGFPLSFQWGVLDPAAADGFAHSSAVAGVLN